jgi:hypothetical protein
VTLDGSIKRHRTDDALDKFASCVLDLTTEVQKHMNNFIEPEEIKGEVPRVAAPLHHISKDASAEMSTTTSSPSRTAASAFTCFTNAARGLADR